MTSAARKNTPGRLSTSPPGVFSVNRENGARAHTISAPQCPQPNPQSFLPLRKWQLPFPLLSAPFANCFSSGFLSLRKQLRVARFAILLISVFGTVFDSAFPARRAQINPARGAGGNELQGQQKMTRYTTKRARASRDPKSRRFPRHLPALFRTESAPCCPSGARCCPARRYGRKFRPNCTR